MSKMMGVKKTFLMICAIVMGIMQTLPAVALLLPEPLATDSRIKTILYSPNEVYKFTGHYGYQSVIEFGADEQIMTVSIGDSIAWQLKPAGSRLFIKPIEQDALTNMTVITNHHTYHFEIHAQETASIDDAEMIFVLRFIYSAQVEQEMMTNLRGQDPVPDIMDEEVRKKLNFNYSIVGPDSIAPIRIFDDGEFTYFEFKDKNADLPAFYLVDPLLNESMLNFRTVDDYIVVERVGARFTLRSGAYVLCVYNETMPMDKIPQPEDESIWSKIF